jgi:thiamine biosynthesis lipoprotein
VSDLQVREGRALGSRLRLTVAADGDPGAIDTAWAAVLEAFDDVDRSMSRFRDDSELTLLNRRITGRSSFAAVTAPVFVPSRLLARALVVADRARRMTGGRFDARVLADLERLDAPGVPQGTGGLAPRRLPAPLVTRGDRGPVSLLAPADLGGLGKGLALRWARQHAEAELAGVPFLLDAGGDLASSGVPAGLPGGGSWSIGIEDPAGGKEPVGIVELWPDQSIATSSIRIGRWSTPDDRAVHHLIDPATGEPGGAGLRAVTVAWPDPAWAEVWSKTLFLEGIRGIAMAARRRGLSAWWIDDTGALSMTAGARMQTTWVRAEATSAA